MMSDGYGGALEMRGGARKSGKGAPAGARAPGPGPRGMHGLVGQELGGIGGVQLAWPPSRAHGAPVGVIAVAACRQRLPPGSGRRLGRGVGTAGTRTAQPERPPPGRGATATASAPGHPTANAPRGRKRSGWPPPENPRRPADTARVRPVPRTAPAPDRWGERAPPAQQARANNRHHERGDPPAGHRARKGEQGVQCLGGGRDPRLGPLQEPSPTGRRALHPPAADPAASSDALTPPRRPGTR